MDAVLGEKSDDFKWLQATPNLLISLRVFKIGFSRLSDAM